VLSAHRSPIGFLFCDFKIRFSAYGENCFFTTYAVFHEYLFNYYFVQREIHCIILMCFFSIFAEGIVGFLLNNELI
jgi:hypothetical protein